MIETLKLKQFLLHCQSSYLQQTLTKAYSEPSQTSEMELLRKQLIALRR